MYARSQTCRACATCHKNQCSRPPYYTRSPPPPACKLYRAWTLRNQTRRERIVLLIVLHNCNSSLISTTRHCTRHCIVSGGDVSFIPSSKLPSICTLTRYRSNWSRTSERFIPQHSTRYQGAGTPLIRAGMPNCMPLIRAGIPNCMPLRHASHQSMPLIRTGMQIGMPLIRAGMCVQHASHQPSLLSPHPRGLHPHGHHLSQASQALTAVTDHRGSPRDGCGLASALLTFCQPARGPK